MKKSKRSALGLVGLGIAAAAGGAAGAYLARVVQSVLWANRQLHNEPSPPASLRSLNMFSTGVTYSETITYDAYQVVHTIENGIERVVYTPHNPLHETPLLFQHGMWHGAWCWAGWQAYFAENGWISIAYSLPGHGLSPEQRPICQCTLEYYLAFLYGEVERLPRAPVLVAHSMGGALAQWMVRFIQPSLQRPLPAYVLAAPWPAFNAFRECLAQFLKADLPGMLQIPLSGSATPFVRSPQVAARLLLSKRAIISPQEFHRRLGPESGLVMFEMQPPRWAPVEAPDVNMLILAAKADALIPLNSLARAAAYYQADFKIIPGAAHDLMFEPENLATAATIRSWLAELNIP